MATYNELSKLSQVKLPNGTQYALVDRGLRYMVSDAWASGASYQVGDYVIYENPTDGKDYLYKCKTANSDDNFTATKWEKVQIVEELENIYETLGNGIHYRGYTTTSLYDGATSTQFPTITINGSQYTPVAGDLVIINLTNLAANYQLNTAYNIHTYLKKVNSNPGFDFFITNDAITAGENTSFDAISAKLDRLTGTPEFLFDGTVWNALGSIRDGLGDLAFKDSATGTYTAPTGTGSVTVKEYSSTKKSLGTTTITGTNGTVIASKASAGTAVDVAKAGAAVVYGKADVGSAVTVGTALGGTKTFVTSAISEASLTGTTTFVTSAISGASLSGTTTFVTSAISGASLGGTQTFNTNAISGVSITGTKTFNTDGVKISTTVNNECLEFVAASTASFDVSTSAASTGTVTLSTNPASTATVSLTTAAAATASVGISTSTAATATVSLTTASITPAVAAPNTQTIVPAVSNGTITPYTFSDVTAAQVAASATTVATGALVDGSDVVIGINATDVDKTVSVGINSNATVVVK